jgi:hypothetical protein
MGSYLQQMLLAQGLQAVIGLLGVALHNPASSTVRIFEKSLLTVRNMALQVFPLDQFPLPQPGENPIPSIGAKPTQHTTQPYTPPPPA